MSYTHVKYTPTVEVNNMTISSDIIRGYNDTILLSTLLTGDSYGYEMAQMVESISEGKYRIKETTLYSCMKRLEKNGYIDERLAEDARIAPIILAKTR